MTKSLHIVAIAAVSTVMVPSLALAQDVFGAGQINAQPGFYIGAGGGIVVPLSSNSNVSGVGWDNSCGDVPSRGIVCRLLGTPAKREGLSVHQ